MQQEGPDIVRLCEVEGCTRAHRARGLCGTHYNQQHQPERHALVDVPCSVCGTTCRKTRSTSRRSVCSPRCRSYLLLGHWPKDKPVTIKREAKPKPVPFAPEARVCTWCGIDYIATDPRRALCSERCSAKAKTVRRRGRAAQAGGTYTWSEVMHLFIALGKRCAYCDELVDGQPDPDHVVPLSRGGSNSITNILPSCRLCNSDKRDLLLHEWAADRARRNLPPRHTDVSQYVHLTSVAA